MNIYGFLTTIIFYATLPFFYLERVIHKKSFGWKEKFGNLKSPFSPDSKIIMLHGVSVGEVIALENLVKKLKETFPKYKLVVTTGTKTGQDIAQKKFDGIADLVTYFPFDIPSAVNKFLDELKPSLVLIAETEIWPNFAVGCKKRNIPICIINGRISDSTYKTYKIAKPFFNEVFKNFTAVYAQSQEDLQKYISLGMKNTEFMGNLKFDIKKKDADIDLGQNGHKVLIGGSTHKGEDEIVLDCFKKLKSEFPNLKLLLAPRHPQRVPEIEQLIGQRELSYGLRSKDEKFTDHDIIILDTLGELGKMYSICDIAFIGGSFNKTGGHNPLEAVVYDKPTLSGPCIHNFKDIYSILQKAGAAKVVSTPNELFLTLNTLLSEENCYNQAKAACRQVFEEQGGALNFVITKVGELLSIKAR